MKRVNQFHFGYLGWRWVGLVIVLVLAATVLIPSQVAHAATITVNTTTDEFNTGSNCSLREAIRAANTDAAFGGCTAGSGADTINLPAGTFTLNTTGQNDDTGATGDLDITQSVTINGATQTTTIIDGNNTDAIFDTFTAGTITINLNNLTLQHGNPTNASFEGGGAIYVKNTVTLNLTAVSLLNNTADSSGGAIYNEGTLTINNSTLSGNQANSFGGALYNIGASSSSSSINNSTLSNNTAEYGGAIYTSSNSGINLSITNSTLSGNSAVDRPGGPAGDFGGGGAIYASTDSQLNLTNSTISGNAAAQNGGGILLLDSNTSGVGTLNLKNVTIASNTANNDNDSGGDGGGVFVSSGTANVQGSIIANNTDNGGTNNHPDVSGTFTNQGNNLIGKNNGSNFTAGALIGTIASPVNPQLGALANNGGSTFTHALLSNSPAIDAAGDTGLATDQRGTTRPQGTADDIGAYEFADTMPPTITNVTSSAANGTYGVGAVIDIQITFSENVIVVGTPQLTLETGASDAVVNYFSGSGTSTLTFRYTVAAGQSSADLDYVSTTALALNGGTIKDGAGNNATLTLPAPGAAGSLGANKNLVIDAIAPTVTINQASGQADPTSTSPINFTVVFNESVTGFTGTDVSFTGSTAGGTLSAAVTGGPTTYNVAVSGMTSGGTVVASVPANSATDAAGNGNAASTSTDSSVTFTADTTPPTVAMTSATSDPTSASPIPVTVTFSENVTGFTAGDITTSNGTVNNFAGSGSTYTFDLVPVGQGTVTANIAAGVAQDTAGNPNTAAPQFSRTYDTVAPTVTINQAGGQADPTSTSPINFTVVFNESVTGFTGTDVSFTGSTAGGTLTANVTGGPTTYNVAVSGMTSSGTVVASLPSGAAQDGAGNPSAPSTSTDNSVTFNVAAPEIDVQGNGQSIANGDTTPTSADHTDFGNADIASETVVRTFTISNTGTANLTVLSVSLSGANVGDFSVNTAPAASVVAGGSTTFQITFDPSAAGVRTATVSIANNDSDENPYTFAIQGTGFTQINTSVTPGTPTTSNNPTPQLCAATGTNLAIYTITLPQQNTSANTFTGLFFRVKELEYTTPQGGQQPSLCNATTVVNNGGVGSILAVPNSSLPGGDNAFNPGDTLTQAFQVGRPVAAQFRIKVDLFSSAVAAASDDQPNEIYLGSFEQVFDSTPEEVTPAQQLFLPLITNSGQ